MKGRDPMITTDEPHWKCPGRTPANDLPHVNVHNIAIAIVHLEYQPFTYLQHQIRKTYGFFPV